MGTVGVTVGQIPFGQFFSSLSNQGLRVKMGPFNVQIGMTCAMLAERLYRLYANYELAECDLAEFHVQIGPARLLKKPFSPHARFLLDGRSLFPPFPAEQALAALGMGHQSRHRSPNQPFIVISFCRSRKKWPRGAVSRLARQWQDHLMHRPGTSGISPVFR